MGMAAMLLQRLKQIKPWMVYTVLNIAIASSFIGFFVHAATTRTDRIPVIFCDAESERSTNWKNGCLVISKDTKSIAYLSDNQYWKLNSDQYSSGTYTPTLTSVANIAATTSAVCHYIKIGDIVFVSGKIDVDPTLALLTVTRVGISIPFASNFANVQELSGVAYASGIAGQGAAIRADVTNDRAEMIWVSNDLTNQPMYFNFTYRVLS